MIRLLEYVYGDYIPAIPCDETNLLQQYNQDPVPLSSQVVIEMISCLGFASIVTNMKCVFQIHPTAAVIAERVLVSNSDPSVRAAVFTVTGKYYPLTVLGNFIDTISRELQTIQTIYEYKPFVVLCGSLVHEFSSIPYNTTNVVTKGTVTFVTCETLVDSLSIHFKGTIASSSATELTSLTVEYPATRARKR